MIGTEFLEGQGLGNQLFCYISVKCMAIDRGYEFGTANQEQFANNIHSDRGMYFLDIDLGNRIDNIEKYRTYDEIEKRVYIPNCAHDRKYGCYISGADPALIEGVEDNTIIYGNLQDEKYFSSHKEEIKTWLKVRPEYDTYDLTKENLCIINMRGGEYTSCHELLLKRNYWRKAMKHMRDLRSDMEFIIITEDIGTANMILPDVKAYHLGMGEDYVAIKNAQYLILSNSSFAFFPAYTNEICKFIIAPKYWSRHNCSDGYWASEQNIYSGWHYMDRKGLLSSAEECREEFDVYKRHCRYKDIQDVTRCPSQYVREFPYIIKEQFCQYCFKFKKRVHKTKTKVRG